VSHYHERSEKNCLNCGTLVEGRYCQNCGQENIEPKESFLGLLTHFIYDITHFDGKFFSTLKWLVARPGFLSKEFISGRRNSYLHPIRMYVFTSAFFFLVFFTLFNAGNIVKTNEEEPSLKRAQLVAARENLAASSETTNDSIARVVSKKLAADIDKEIGTIDSQFKAAVMIDSIKKSAAGKTQKNVKDSLEGKGLKFRHTPIGEEAGNAFIKIDSSDKEDFTTGDFDYTSVLAYQRMQQALPKDKRDGWLKKTFNTRLIALLEQNKEKKQYEYLRAFVENLLHSFPKMLFVSLPIFALLLQLLYRSRKDLLYSDHAIFAIHLYCATFIFLLTWFGIGELYNLSHWGIIRLISVLMILLIFFYEYKGMRYFYNQGRGKTIVKFIILNIMSLLVMIFLLIVFTTISVSQMATNTHH
jgi:hypothetical protein